MLLILSRYKYVVQRWYYRSSSTLIVNSSISGLYKVNFCIIVYIHPINYDTNNMLNVTWPIQIQYDIDNLYYSCSFNLTVNISITGKCKNNCFTCCVNMPRSKDTNNLGNVTPYIEIQPYHWDVILDSIIFFIMNSSISG
jgi:hypothetical protein